MPPPPPLHCHHCSVAHPFLASCIWQGKPGWWEGETNNVYGIFPSRYVKEVEKKL